MRNASESIGQQPLSPPPAPKTKLIYILAYPYLKMQIAKELVFNLWLKKPISKKMLNSIMNESIAKHFENIQIAKHDSDELEEYIKNQVTDVNKKKRRELSELYGGLGLSVDKDDFDDVKQTLKAKGKIILEIICTTPRFEVKSQSMSEYIDYIFDFFVEEIKKMVISSFYNLDLDVKSIENSSKKLPEFKVKKEQFIEDDILKTVYNVNLNIKFSRS